jgi:hypothetical protein
MFVLSSFLVPLADWQHRLLSFGLKLADVMILATILYQAKATPAFGRTLQKHTVFQPLILFVFKY